MDFALELYKEKKNGKQVLLIEATEEYVATKFKSLKEIQESIDYLRDVAQYLENVVNEGTREVDRIMSLSEKDLH